MSGLAEPMRTLPTRPEPCPGESFVSYVDRLAAHSGVRLLTALARTGVIDRDRYHAASGALSGYGVFLPPERIQTFCMVTRIPNEAAAGMLMTRYHGLVGDFSDVALSTNSGLTRAGRKKWVYFSGSHACPSCIYESGGAWKLAWKLPWSFACLRHRNLLVQACPSCGLRLLSGRERQQCFPPSASQAVDPGTCHNMRPSRGPSATRYRLCGQPLHEVEAGSLDPRGRRVARTQEHLNRVLAGARPTIGGVQVIQPEYFSELQILSRWILSHGIGDDLGELPPAAEMAFDLHLRQRRGFWRRHDQQLEDWGRGKATADPEDSQREWDAIRAARRSWDRPWVPESANLLAAVVPLAVAILGSPSQDAMVEAMSPLVSRMKKDGQVFPLELYLGNSRLLRPFRGSCLESKSDPIPRFAGRPILAQKLLYSTPTKGI